MTKKAAKTSSTKFVVGWALRAYKKAEYSYENDTKTPERIETLAMGRTVTYGQTRASVLARVERRAKKMSVHGVRPARLAEAAFMVRYCRGGE